MNFIETFTAVIESFIDFFTGTVIGPIGLLSLSVVIFCISVRAIYSFVCGPGTVSDDSTDSDHSQEYVIKLNGEDI